MKQCGVSIRREPLNLKPGDEWCFTNEWSRPYPAPRFIEIANAIVTIDGVAFKQNELVEESLLFPQQRLWFRAPYLMLTKLTTKRRSLSTKVRYLLVHNAWAPGYYHWITETLTRIMAAESRLRDHVILVPSGNNGIYDRRSALKSTLKPTPFIMHSGNFYEPSLQPFDGLRLERINPNEYIYVPNLTIVTHTADCGNYNDCLVQQIRTKYRRHFQVSDRPPCRRLFVSRDFSQRRRIINQDKVNLVLSEFGYETVYYEHLSFGDQVKLTASAISLVGLHGGGLTNSMFMSRSTFLLELRVKNDGANNCYFSLANALGVNYLYQFCEPSGMSSVQDADVVVDLDELRINLEIIERHILLFRS